jgi:hypothetical protein
VRPTISRSTFSTLLAAALGLLPTVAAAHEPKPETLTAFNRYREQTQARMDSDLLAGHFLYFERYTEERRQSIDEQLRRGEFYLEPLHTPDDDHKFSIPGGLLHHWVGIAFLPGATVEQTKSVLDDYAHHNQIYFPDVRQSKLLLQNGESREVFLQFYSKTLVTAVFNVNMSSDTTDYSPTRTAVRACSTRVVEVDDYGKPGEHELRPADSHGYLWELCTWWHIEKNNGGTYIQVEVIELSRTVPFGFGWLINPLIRNVPKTFLSHLLSATKKAVAAKSAAPEKLSASLPRFPKLPDRGQPPSATLDFAVRNTASPLSAGSVLVLPITYNLPLSTYRIHSQPRSAICSSCCRASELPFFDAATNSTRA